MKEISNELDLSIVIPVYNNADSLEILLSNIKSEMISKNPGIQYEVILVDDGSLDKSWQIMSSGYKGLRIRAVKLTRNFGQLGAMKAGYEQASGKCLISISADLQDPVYLISKMLLSWSNGYDLVLCARSSRDDNKFIKFSSKLAYFILSREVKNIPSGGFDVFLFSKHIRDNLMNLKGRFNFLQGDLLSFGYKFETIEYHREKRPFGKSGYTFRKRFRNFQDALFDSNYSLINFFMKVGSIISFIGFILGFIILIGKVFGKAPYSGFTLIACSILFIGGIQITLTALVGQYVYRIYDAARQRPSFHIEKIEKTYIK